MAPTSARPRSNTSGSNTSSRPRPISRASTTSINTTSAPSMQNYRHVSESHIHQPPPQSAHTQSLHYTPEEMITRSQRQLTNPNQELAIDPSLQNHPAHARAISAGHGFTTNMDARGPIVDHHPCFSGKEPQFIVNLNDEQTQDEAGCVEERKKKGSASSIANDQELRRLFRENNHRNLKDVAAAVLANERGPKSEKTKQIFAMNWLNTVCKKSSSSVPRNRVFTLYATRCGTERVPPLNPASFGKLVRIIFPGIQTRRLGVRGESKYHYVDLALIDDQQEGHESGQMQPVEIDTEEIEEQAAGRHRQQLPADTAIFPSPNPPPITGPFQSRTRESKASGCLYLDSALPNLQQRPSRPNMVRRQLQFPTHQEPPYAHDEPIELPNLQTFIPAGTDPDAANALLALYRSHCISVIDCFRFCKERMFWHNFTSFHGTLTVPVQKLFAHPDIAAWIVECDWLMYQKMIRFVSPLALQVMPSKVIDTFRTISTKLGPHVSHTFQNHPQHVRDAKLGPATIFAGLIGRLLRVNATAHAAANMLTNDANRDQMWHDWVCYVRPVSVVESSLPGCGYTRTLQILTNEVYELLGPLTVLSYQEMLPIYANATSNVSLNFPQQAQSDLDDSSTSGVLDRWITFLHHLPSRFPRVDPRLLLHCVGEVSSAALRDITMAQALSFGSWWVTKVWVDEMLQWLAEKGGFLEHSPSSMEIRPRKRSAYEAALGVDEASETYGGSRAKTDSSESANARNDFGSVDMRHNLNHDHLSAELQNRSEEDGQPLTAQMSAAAPSDINKAIPQYMTTKEVEMQQGNDDSGIVLDLDLPSHEPIRLADYGGFVAAVNGASDPADVVVC